jgi:DtxR family Mn-dependent transcriptional regulator
MLSKAIENYLKAIFSIKAQGTDVVSTNAISDKLSTRPSSVTDMIKKLTEKKLVTYERYKGVKLTNKGQVIATNIVRKHRLWETFLVEKLHFKWDEVHDVAEQLEHIKSEKLVDLLDDYLDSPKFDPHGDPIPNREGDFPLLKTLPLTSLSINQQGLVMGVLQDEPSFLKYLTKLNISLGSSIQVIDKIEFDQSIEINIDNKNIHISVDVAKNILIKA